MGSELWSRLNGVVPGEETSGVCVCVCVCVDVYIYIYSGPD